MKSRRVDRIVYVVAAGAFIASAALYVYGPVPTGNQWIAAGFFASLGVIGSLLGYKTSDGTTGSIGFLPFLSAALISPNYAALCTVLVSIVFTELIARRAPIKALFNVGQTLLAEVFGVGVYLALGGASLLDEPPHALAFLALVSVFFVLNKLAVSTVVATVSGGDTRTHWTRSMRGSAVYDVFAFPLIYLFAMIYAQVGPEWSAALALPLLGLRQLYKQNFALQKINEELLQLMVAAIEARDPYTSGHSQRVARYARVIARAAGLGKRETERIAIAALLHDVGKIHEEFAPILRKPGRLTDAEFAVMKSHPQRGAALIAKVSHFADLVPAVEAHHEAWDGRGYPLGAKGETIPVAARVIALADTIDAMSTSRPYREALSAEAVRAELLAEAGRQFDPRICEALLTSEGWGEIVGEIRIATSEYPVLPVVTGNEGVVASGSTGLGRL